MTIVAVVREVGLTKFGSCPSGGTANGTAQRSAPGGTSEEAIVIRDHEGKGALGCEEFHKARFNDL